MNRQQLRHLLDKLKLANLATVKPNGTPHIVPISFVVSDGDLWFTSKKTSIKCRNILKNNNVAVSIVGHKHVILIEGTAEILSPLEESLTPELSKAFVSKYYRARRNGPDAVLVKVKPVRILGGKFGRKQVPLDFGI